MLPFWILLRGIQNGLVTAFSGGEYVMTHDDCVHQGRIQKIRAPLVLILYITHSQSLIGTTYSVPHTFSSSCSSSSANANPLPGPIVVSTGTCSFKFVFKMRPRICKRICPSVCPWVCRSVTRFFQ